MRSYFHTLFAILLLIFVSSCNQSNKQSSKVEKTETIEESVSTNKSPELKPDPKEDKQEEEKEEVEKLTVKSAIPFFFEYEKKNPETKVRIKTSYGNIDIELFKETPYHRANFIFLTKNGYFNGTYFHRVVKNFIIQDGNSDEASTQKKRFKIGQYLLPPDTKKGFKHHRGTISMPSSDIDNPHQLASPYEFFIVNQSPGAYHLDGKYSAFGRVIAGMDVVDAINSIPTDDGEWPVKNVRMEVIILE